MQYLLDSIESISNCSSYSIENDTTHEFNTTVKEFNSEYSDNDENEKPYGDNHQQIINTLINDHFKAEKKDFSFSIVHFLDDIKYFFTI